METPLGGTVLEAIASGRGDMGYQPGPAGVPCQARPGSREKVAALAARIENGQELWHERDKRDQE